jgi:hypothetical protein
MDADSEGIFIMEGSNRLTTVDFVNVKTFTEDTCFVMREIYSEIVTHLQLLDLVCIDI